MGNIAVRGICKKVSETKDLNREGVETVRHTAVFRLQAGGAVTLTTLEDPVDLRPDPAVFYKITIVKEETPPV